MFRRKEEGFDFDSDSEENTMNENTGSQSAMQPHNNEENRSQLQGRAPSASAAPAYRPVAGVSPVGGMQQAAAPAYSPARPVAPPSKPMGSAPGASPSASGMGAKGGKRILTVGNDILLKGEIATCDRLVIEGEVDAKLKDVHTVEIAETGSFKGTAQIQDAEISGLFEGTLVVRNRLTIYSTGKVRGKISYGEVEIERGGQLTGEINIQGSDSSSSAPGSSSSSSSSPSAHGVKTPKKEAA